MHGNGNKSAIASSWHRLKHWLEQSGTCLMVTTYVDVLIFRLLISELFASFPLKVVNKTVQETFQDTELSSILRKQQVFGTISRFLS